MNDDTQYPSLIVNSHDNDYRQQQFHGGDMRPFSDIEAAREKLLRDCEIIKDRLEQGGHGTRSVGLASLKLRSDATAKSYRPQEAFTQSTCPVIGDSGEPGEMLVLVSPSNLENLSKKISKMSKKGSTQLTSIESFTLLEKEHRFPEEVYAAVKHDLETKGESVLKVRVPQTHLFSPLYRNELEQTMSSLLGMDKQPYLTQGDFATYAVHIKDIGHAVAIASLQFIEQLAIMPTYTSSGSAVVDVASMRLPKSFPKDDLPIVAIVDSGIDPSSPLEPLVYKRAKWVSSNCYNPEHGTAVAALVAAEGGTVSSSILPRCRLLDVTIIPNSDPAVGDTDKLYEDALVSKLEQAVELYHKEVKHWNLSLATKTPSTCPKVFSDLAMALDNLHKRYDVFFYCSPGNNAVIRSSWPPLSNIMPESWVAAPGDTLCNLTVGSCASDDTPDDAMAPAGAPSPFSPRGPVAYSIIKPDLVEVGGNLDCNGDPLGVETIGRNGEYLADVGTSFSTPRVCGTSAVLSSYIEKSNTSLCSSLLLSKALMLHHASIPNSLIFNGSVRLSDFYGHGCPSLLDEMIADPFWRSTSVICGRLYPDGQELCIEDFPYPDGLSTGRSFFGRLWVTMVSEPIVDPSHRVEYARSGIDLHFGVMRNNKFEKQVSCIHTSKGNSTPLNQKEFKWSPVKKYRSERMMQCKGDYWRLRAHLMLRREESDLIKKIPSQAYQYPVDVVIVVTIEDPQRQVQVSNQMYQKWRTRGNLVTQIQVANRIRAQYSPINMRY